MTKKEKYLKSLEESLLTLEKEDREKIVLKYSEFIDKRLVSGDSIPFTIEVLGPADKLAKKYVRKDEKKKRKNLRKEIKEENKQSEKEEISNSNNSKKVRKKKLKHKNKGKINKKDIKTSKDSLEKSNIKSSLKNKFKSFTENFKAKKVSGNKKNKIKNLLNGLKTIKEKNKKNLLLDEKYKKEVKLKRKNYPIWRQALVIIFKISGILLLILAVLLLLTSSSLFVASLFMVLDGVKFYGIPTAFLGVTLLMAWILYYVNSKIIDKKIKYKPMFISFIGIIVFIGLGIGLFFKEYYSVKVTDNIDTKYSLKRSFETYVLPNDTNKKYNITFNSWYNTQYVIEYDNSLKDEFTLEIKYYEVYYDLSSKKESLGLYVSLHRNARDLISLYIDNLKERIIYNEQELGRYTVKITINEKDKNRIVVK